MFPEIFGGLFDYSVCPGAELITVEHLLSHTTGCWPTTTREEDPVFSKQTLSTPKLIQHVLNETKLTQPPGSTFLYSNFGYLLLGRIIEIVSGRSYLRYIRECFKTDVQIAGKS